MSKANPAVLPILVLAGLLAGTAAAQISGGVFRGEVRDATKALVPHAKILIHSNDTGVEFSAESNGEGLYLSPTLIPGSYLLTAAKPGFKSEDFGPVILEVNQTVRVDFGLSVGPVTESVRVEAGGTQLLSTEGRADFPGRREQHRRSRRFR